MRNIERINFSFLIALITAIAIGKSILIALDFTRVETFESGLILLVSLTPIAIVLLAYLGILIKMEKNKNGI